MNDYFVYIYCYPNTDWKETYLDDRFKPPGKPLYVGYGKNLRHLAHLKEAMSDKVKKTPKWGAIRTILESGLQPIIVKIREGLSKQEACDLEIRLIAEIGTRVKVDGVDRSGPLLNLHKGGHGGYIPRSPETLKKLSEKMKGRVLTEEWKRNISKGKSGVKLSQSHRQKISDGLRIALNAPGMSEKLSKAQKNKTWTAEHSKAASERMKNRVVSEITRRKMSEANKGFTHTEETKNKISTITKEAMAAKEIRERMKESSKARWANPEERAKIGAKNAKSFRLTNIKTGEIVVITNMKNFCRENNTDEYWVRKDYLVERL